LYQQHERPYRLQGIELDGSEAQRRRWLLLDGTTEIMRHIVAKQLLRDTRRVNEPPLERDRMT